MGGIALPPTPDAVSLFVGPYLPDLPSLLPGAERIVSAASDSSGSLQRRRGLNRAGL
ncbi:MAG: hypothetical protein MUC41_16590 [Syntrophobacteraceae bacterium]|nr:hypothetical protein [Syntrophobacteraceae bacterium]